MTGYSIYPDPLSFALGVALKYHPDLPLVRAPISAGYILASATQLPLYPIPYIRHLPVRFSCHAAHA